MRRLRADPIPRAGAPRFSAPTSGRQLVYDSAMFLNTQQVVSHARFR